MSYLVGLTGGIGSGKSTVAILFKECGVTVVDSDDISHQLTRAGGEAIAAIRAEFGDEYIEDNGALDRSRMRRLVFSDPDCQKTSGSGPASDDTREVAGTGSGEFRKLTLYAADHPFVVRGK